MKRIDLSELDSEKQGADGESNDATSMFGGMTSLDLSMDDQSQAQNDSPEGGGFADIPEMSGVFDMDGGGGEGSNVAPLSNVTTSDLPLGDGGLNIIDRLKLSFSIDRIKLIGLITLVLGAIYAVFAVDSSGDFFGDILEFVGLDSEDDFGDVGDDLLPKVAEAIGDQVEAVADSVTNTVKSSINEVRNPYWPLPNPELKRPGGLRKMTGSQQERWESGLSHRYYAQRYLTLKSIRSQMTAGSEALLFKALGQPKFWLRMEALRGLADLGLSVDVDTVERAIGRARPSLVKNYLKRLTKNPTMQDYYLLRQSIRLVGERARLLILKTLAKSRGGVNELYLAAGTVDPSPLVSRYMSRIKASDPIETDSLSKFRNIVDSYRNGKLSPDSDNKVRVEEIKIEELDDEDTTGVSFLRDNFKEDEIVAPSETGSGSDGFDDFMGF